MLSLFDSEKKNCLKFAPLSYSLLSTVSFHAYSMPWCLCENSGTVGSYLFLTTGPGWKAPL